MLGSKLLLVVGGICDKLETCAGEQSARSKESLEDRSLEISKNCFSQGIAAMLTLGFDLYIVGPEAEPTE